MSNLPMTVEQWIPKPQIQFTVGISACGKTTYAVEWCKENNGVRIERDAIRALYQRKSGDFKKASFGDYCQFINNGFTVDWPSWKWKNEQLVTDKQKDLIEQAYEIGCSIIVSDTNLNPGRLAQFKDWAETIGFEVQEDKTFDEVTLEEAWARDNARANGVGHSVIFRQWIQRQEILNKPLIDAALKKRPMSRRGARAKSAVIFDIDGTLATNTGRDIYDWSKVHTDEPISHIMDILHAYNDAGKTVLIVSGRDAVCRKGTEAWLKEHGAVFHDLFMRSENDRRRDTEVKKEILLNNILPYWDVELVFDDRPSVVRMWQSMGIPTAAVGWPHAEF